MRVNFTEAVATRRLLCRPYRAAYVPTYHGWMQDPWLRAATASDALTLEQEYAAQRGWVDDDDKLTFIFFDAEAAAAAGAAGAGAPAATAGMAGDANLFILDAAAARDEYWPGGAGRGGVAEVMVMVGEPRMRRRGYAREAVIALMRYGAERLGVRGFVAKIAADNAASRALFASLGFREAKAVPAFDEVHCVREWADGDFAAHDFAVVHDEPPAGEA